MESMQRKEIHKIGETMETIFPDGLVTLMTKTTSLAIWGSKLNATNVTILEIHQKIVD